MKLNSDILLAIDNEFVMTRHGLVNKLTADIGWMRLRMRSEPWLIPKSQSNFVLKYINSLVQAKIDLIIATCEHESVILDEDDIDRLMNGITLLIHKETGDNNIDKVETSAIEKEARLTLETVMKTMAVDFSFVTDQRMAVILKRDYTELQRLNPKMTAKSVLISAAGIIEGLLTDALIANGTYTFDEILKNRFLKDLLFNAKRDGIIQEENVVESLRVFRNLIHPIREINDGLSFSKEHAIHAKTSVDVIITEVRTWYSKRTP